MDKKKIVVLTGAGISAESGLRTFRDTDGLWEGHNVMEVCSTEAWVRNPAFVLDFYNMRRKDVAQAKPNEAHYGLAALEKDFEVHIVTQNIDDLHERAGSTNVIHLHGSVFKMHSERSLNPQYDIKTEMNIGDKAPDGGQLRPGIVWFGEAVPLIEPAARLAAAADIFVVVGTSMQVYPAAGLLGYVPLNVPKYIIDKSIPPIRSVPNLTTIEKPATAGVQQLIELLNNVISLNN